jgi:hypothetical protein
MAKKEIALDLEELLLCFAITRRKCLLAFIEGGRNQNLVALTEKIDSVVNKSQKGVFLKAPRLPCLCFFPLLPCK